MTVRFYLIAAVLSSFFMVVNGVSKELNASACAPVNDRVYLFLENCAVRGVLPLSMITQKPASRSEISSRLQHVVSNYTKLDDSRLVEDLKYYVQEYAIDIKRLDAINDRPVRNVRPTGFSVAKLIKSPHWRLSAFYSDDAYFVFDPVASGRLDVFDSKTIFRRNVGFRFFGDFYKQIGYYFKITDWTERGNAPYNSRADLLEDRYGYVGPLDGGEETYYDFTEAYITANWKSFDFFFGKDNVEWQPGSENLVLSGDAPSFDHFRMNVEISRSIRFTYLVGKLHPYQTPKDTLYTTDLGWTRLVFVNKWMTAHRLEYLWKNRLIIGIGESLIWGDRGLDIAYLNPLNAFVSAEHDGDDQDNVLLHGDVSLRFFNRGLIYGTILIDDIKMTSLGEGNPGNKHGFTAGFKLHDMNIDGLSGMIEYFRLEPFVYSHFFPINRYTTWTSSLGSNIAPNSDRLRVGMKYRLKRNLSFTVKADHYRHGSIGGDINEPIPKNFNEKVYFLDGDRSEWTEFEANLVWEAIPGGFVQLGSIWNTEKTLKKDRFYLGVSYRL